MFVAVGAEAVPTTPDLAILPPNETLPANAEAVLTVKPDEFATKRFVPSLTVHALVVALVNPLNTEVVGFNRAITEANSSFNNSKLLLIVGLEDDTESVPKISVMFAILVYFTFIMLRLMTFLLLYVSSASS